MISTPFSKTRSSSCRSPTSTRGKSTDRRGSQRSVRFPPLRYTTSNSRAYSIRIFVVESRRAMTFTISLPPDAEERLKQRAAAAGQDLPRYIEDVLAKELAAPLSLAEA